ncbi:MAG: NADPH-dependent F420 reductase [Armatimonadota bacterium]|nr:NADPH-dependent F420 reductase [Armatimonadota bacterium]MDR7404306.1 NADPH-dependent F420 reductase [Armatimonadota bacterium]
MVAIVGGTGRLGRGLAARWAQAGVPVLIGSRDPARAREAARAAGLSEAAGADNRAAAAAADVVVLTVPFAAHRQTLLALADVLAGKILLDTTVPLLDSRELACPEAGSAAQDAQALVPAARVVAGFHTVSAHLLADRRRPLRGDVLLCGDDPSAKEAVERLVRALGARPVDAGGLSAARTLEMLALLLLNLNRRYRRRDLGVRIVGLEDAGERDVEGYVEG